MITKSSLQQVSRIAGACLLAGSVVACGDDGGGSTPIDAGGTPDACVGSGHTSGCIDSPFQLPEGGEFRLERFQFSPDSTNDALAGHAFFFRGQTPDFRELAGPAIDLRPDIAEIYSCHDMRRGDFFDNGKSPEAQVVADSREYFDVGGARLVNTADENDVIELTPNSQDSMNPRATTDESAQLVHDILYKSDPENTDVQLFARYEPRIDGSSEYPSLDLKFGQSAAGDELSDSNGNGTPQIYMPAGFTMTEPAEENFYEAKSLIFTRGVDKILRYTLDNPEPVGEPGGYPTIIPFIGFVDDEGKVNAYCFKNFEGELDDGEFIVPHEVLEIIPAQPSDSAYIIFGRFTHVAWEVQREPLTRLDFVGVECLISFQWEVVDP